MAACSVTPPVGVVLVAVFVFMGSAPPLTVSVRADGALFLNETEVDYAALGPRLQAMAVAGMDKPIYIRADGRAPYERVAQVMARLQAAGFTSIGLITDTGAPAPAEG